WKGFFDTLVELLVQILFPVVRQLLVFLRGRAALLKAGAFVAFFFVVGHRMAPRSRAFGSPVSRGQRVGGPPGPTGRGGRGARRSSSGPARRDVGSITSRDPEAVQCAPECARGRAWRRSRPRGCGYRS